MWRRSWRMRSPSPRSCRPLSSGSCNPGKPHSTAGGDDLGLAGMGARRAMIGVTIDVRRKLFPAVGGSPSRLVYEGFSLEVAPGTCMGLLGPSGTGKTTLLNMVAGLDPEYEGRIAFKGAD